MSTQQQVVAWMWQHEETGAVGFIDQWQVDNGWQKANPRLRLIRPLVFADDAKVVNEPLTTAKVIAWLEGRATNTDTDPRWVAAQELRRLPSAGDKQADGVMACSATERSNYWRCDEAMAGCERCEQQCRACREPDAPSFTDEELAARFTKTHGGPNPYYACKACGEDVPSLRNLLVEHAAIHGKESLQ